MEIYDLKKYSDVHWFIHLVNDNQFVKEQNANEI